MVLFGVCVLVSIVLFIGWFNDPRDVFGSRLGGGFIGLIFGAIVGAILLCIVGANLPYKTVTQTQSLVAVKDVQGVHQGFCLASGMVKDSAGNKVTRYYYYYQVPGGYNPGSVDTSDGTVTVQQNAEAGECVLLHHTTVWSESWFQYMGFEFQSNRYDFMLSPGTYQPSDQLGS